MTTPVCLPCPFCGSTCQLVSNLDGDPDLRIWWAECLDEDKCGASTAPATTREEAAAIWNKRTSVPAN
ncbi:hypothetical protein GCM10017044_10340 [Kordiimonas sediminis]|uniref:Restriction alleviation protein, Lar family n=1 Tax=Kordiimonas sediminis TaxID=1735581 RepID=A0A919ANJ9_9PROT|nr:Lar family restriction alleviation protein [Kordiimonas sediminis]GHF17826.1 hypothetical protein GCM10017044_10340 [Kordiimonas sediminis]